MRAVRSNRITRAGWKLHRLVYGRLGGRLGTRIGPHPVLLLTTRGRRSGAEHTVPLNYQDTTAGLLVIGSYSGEPRDPAWALNLRAHPEADVRIGRHTHRIRAVELHGAEREAVAQKFEAIDAAYRTYRQWTERVLPVFRLEPVA